MTRNGKIARLPHAIREELNHRLRDGEPGKKLVAWLNSSPAVQKVLATEFAGCAITPQSLSEWKKGGYRDWTQQQEALAAIAVCQSQVAEVSNAHPGALTELLTTWLVTRYAVATHNLQGPVDWRRLRELCSDLVALRKGDHSAARLALEREQWIAETNRAEQAEAELRKLKPIMRLVHRKALLSVLGIAPLNSPIGLADLTDDDLATLLANREDAPPPSESESIRPDPIHDPA